MLDVAPALLARRFFLAAIAALLVLVAVLFVAARAEAQGVVPKTGDLFVADRDAGGDGHGAIIRIKPAHGQRKMVSENLLPQGNVEFTQPHRLAFEADGNLVVSGFFKQNGLDYAGVIRVDPNTGARSLVSGTGTSGNIPGGGPSFASPGGIAVESTGDIVVADDASNQIIRIDPRSGARTTASANPAVGALGFVSLATDVEVESNGDLLLLDSEGLPTAPDDRGLIDLVDPTTGARSRLSDNLSAGAGSLYHSPTAMVLDGGGNVLALNSDPNNYQSRGVVQADKVTGARSFVQDNLVPSTLPLFNNVRDFTRKGQGDTMFVTQISSNQGVATNPQVLKSVPSAGTRTLTSDNSNPMGGPNLVSPDGIVAVKLVISGVQIAGGPIVARAGGARATTLSYTLGQKARVAVAIARRVPGRIVDGKCVAGGQASEDQPACVVNVEVRTLKYAGRKGANTHPFGNRLRKLPRGAYRATLTATNAAGDASVPVSRDFQVRR